MPCLNLVFERSRTKISIGMWRDNIRHCAEKLILDIGTGEGQTSPEALGFSEVYFQYFIPLAHRTFVAFPLEQEALLKVGHIVKFDS